MMILYLSKQICMVETHSYFKSTRINQSKIKKKKIDLNNKLCLGLLLFLYRICITVVQFLSLFLKVQKNT